MLAVGSRKSAQILSLVTEQKSPNFSAGSVRADSIVEDTIQHAAQRGAVPTGAFFRALDGMIGDGELNHSRAFYEWEI